MLPHVHTQVRFVALGYYVSVLGRRDLQRAMVEILNEPTPTASLQDQKVRLEL